MLKQLTISVAVLVSTSLIGSGADGAWKSRPFVRCEAVVDQRLDQINVNRADIKKIFYTKQVGNFGGDDGMRTVGVDGWVQFHSCKGYLVIDMDNFCRVRQVYTRGQCRIPGL